MNTDDPTGPPAGPAARLASSAAVPLTLSDAERDRVEAVDRLMASGPAAVPSLLDMLDEPSWTVRRSVVGALAALGDAAVAPLCDRLRAHRRNEAAVAATVDALVGSCGDVDPAVAAMAADPSPAVVADVAQILGRRQSTACVTTLIALTTHQDDNVAVAAIEALGRVGGRAAVESLIVAARSGNFFRTFPAIDVLGRSGDPRAVGPLAELLDSRQCGLEAARALGRTGDRNAVEPLAARLVSAGENDVRVAALALGELHQRYAQRYGSGRPIEEQLRQHAPARAVRRLTQLLAASEPDEQAAICVVLGCIGTEAAVPALTALLTAGAPVAAAASQALRRVGRDDDAQLIDAIRSGDSARRLLLLPLITRAASTEEVIRCLDDADGEVRMVACETLARIGSPRAVPALFARLGDRNAGVVQAAVGAIQSLGGGHSEALALEAAASPAAPVRRAALRILSYFAFPSALDACLAALRDPDVHVRDAAVSGLPYLDDPRALDALLAATRDGEPRTRAAAMRALGHTPAEDVRATSALIKGLGDPDGWVRYYACQSLGRLGCERAAEAIAARLGDEAGQVRVAAVESLSHLTADVAFAALKQAAASDDADVRRAALVGLGISKRPEALPVLLEAAGAPDASTRLVALSAVAGFDDARVVPVLARGAADPDESVRNAAVGFLAGRRGVDATNAIVALLRRNPGHERLLEALAIPSEGRISGIATALHAADDETAAQLTAALARMRRADATAALVDALVSSNVRARKAAAPTLAAIGTREAMEALKRAFAADADPEVRRICALLLSQ